MADGIGIKIADAYVEIHARGQDRVGREVRDTIRGDRDFDGAGDDAGRRFGSAFGDGIERGGLASRMGALGTSLGGHLTRGLLGSLGSLGSVLTKTMGLATLAGGIASVGGAAASSAGFVTTFAAELVPLGGLVAALPGALGMLAAAGITLKMSLYGVGDAMKAAYEGDMKKFDEAMAKLTPSAQSFAREFLNTVPALKTFQQAAQTGFFSELNGSLGRFTELLKGTQPWIQGLATNMGSVVRTFLEWATSSQSITGFNTILGNTSGLVTAIREALKPLLTGFLDMAVAGSNWLNSFAPALKDALTTFGEWMSKAAASGKVTEWLDNAVVVLKQVWSIGKDLWGIFEGVFKAARDAGTGVLGILGTLLDGMNKWVNSAKGQEVLVTVFQSLQRIGLALMPVFEALVGAVGILAPKIADIAVAVGPVLAAAVEALAPALAELAPGIIAVFKNLGQAVENLASGGALQDVGKAISDILVAVSPLLPAIGQLAGPILSGLASVITNYVAPGLSTLVGWIQQAVDWLTGKGLAEDSWLTRVITTIRDNALPVWQQIGDLIGKVFNDIVTWFQNNQGTVQEWGERIISIINSVGSIISGLWEGISLAWDAFGKPLLDSVGGVFSGILQVIDGALTYIKGLVNVVLGLITGDWQRAWDGVKQMFSGTWEAIKGVFNGVVAQLKLILDVFLSAFGDSWSKTWDAAKNALSTAWNNITSSISSAIDSIKSWISSFLSGVSSTWNSTWDSVGSFLSNTWSNIKNWVSDAIGNVRNSISGALSDISSKWNSAWDNVSDFVSRIWSNIQDAVGKAIGDVRGTISSALSSVQDVWRKGWDSVSNFLGDAWNNIRNGVGNGINSMLDTVRGIPGRIRDAIGNLGNMLYDSGRSLIQGLINGLNSMLQDAYNAASDLLNKVRSLFPFSPAKEGPFSGRGWVEYSGQSIAQGFARGMVSGVGTVNSAAQGVIGAAAGPVGVTPAGFAASAGGAGATTSTRTVQFGDIHLTVQGILDFRQPDAGTRTVVLQLREALRQLETEYA
ncbi:hypothetical protein ACFYOK_10830 [Microbispora bryophytorum]|uniref:phage tail protein n=1 Tax=Microbispora bryophytorum TaxID=1460882 RepID=UPI003409C02A